MVPNSKMIVDALTQKNVPFECRSCGDASQLKLDIAGVTLTALGASAVNSSVSSLRYTPMALITCGSCGETRFYHLEWLGFKPPY